MSAVTPSPGTVGTTVGTIAGIVAVALPGLPDDVKAIVTAGIALIIAVYTWQTHRTARNADVAAAQVAIAKTGLGHLAELAQHLEQIVTTAIAISPSPSTTVDGTTVPDLDAPAGQHEAPDVPTAATLPPVVVPPITNGLAQ